MRISTLALLLLYPIAWVAPLMRAGLLPLLGLQEVSVVSGVAALWKAEPALAVLVALFAFVAPYVKIVGLSLVQWRLLPERFLAPLHVLGKFAMADVFLIALYIIVIKGVSYTTIDVAWGMYLFSACILSSIVLGLVTDRQLRQ